jgi:formylglycine-generating enzyme required for sulfatase activity
MRNALLTLLLAALSLPLLANNITVSNLSLSNENRFENYTFVTFDLTWENSWRLNTGAANWDAAWVFVKYRIGNGEWQHANLHNIEHTAGTGTPATITTGLLDDNTAFDATTNPGMGVFVYRSSAAYGTFINTGLKLRWNYGADGIVGTNIDVKVFAIEMVRVQEGAFNVGGGGGTNAFTSTTINTANATTAPTGSGALGGAAGGYPSGQTAPDNASWPNGYNAFYCMKYEVSQQQYVDFLNTLTQTQADARKYTGSVYRCAITGSAVGTYTTMLPYVACNYLSWADGAAYADWSGLRPMTELEFEKACRGDQPAVSGEYAWGTAGIASSAYTLSNAGAANEGIATNYSTTVGNAVHHFTNYDFGPLRVGVFAANGMNNGRVSAGASYWGIMELSGNLWERSVTIDNLIGRAFNGKNGDGLLENDGTASMATLPATDAIGAGLRGGTWGDATTNLQVSDRYFAFYSYPEKGGGVGFRAVRN